MPQTVPSLVTTRGPAARLVHDLNNSLNSIALLTELIRGELHGEHPLVDDLSAIITLVRQSRELTRRMLTSKPPAASAIDLAALVRQHAALLRGILRSRGSIRLQWDEAPKLVPLDSCRATQILLNLVTNAAAALGHTGAVSVRVSGQLVPLDCLEQTLPPGDKVLLEVADDGHGMDAETLARACEPGFTTRGDQGHGLGLSSVKCIVSEAGGVMEITSTRDVGTRVRIWFPCAR